MMSRMPLQGILIIDSENLRIAIRNDDHLLTGSYAFLGTGRACRTCHFGATLGVGNPSVDGCALSHVVEGQR